MNDNIQIPVVMAGELYINGMLPVYVDDETFTLTSGYARDSSDVTDIILNEDITVYTTTQGVINGIDTGTVTASRWYAVYAVSDSSEDNPTGALISLNYSAPQLVFGYDTTRLVGYVYIDSASHIAEFYYVGYQNYRQCYLQDSLATTIGGSGSATYSTFSFGVKLPAYSIANNKMVAILNAEFAANTAGNGAFFATLGFSGSGNGQVYLKSPVVTEVMAMQLDVPVSLGSGDAMWMAWKTTSASDALTITLTGMKFTV